MSARSFIDTNVLVYADSADAVSKQIVAAELLRRHMVAATGVLSTQVVQEYTSVALRKLDLTADAMRTRLAFFGEFEIVPASLALIGQALELKWRWQLSFWDAMIVQAARQSGCSELLTEDMNTGAVVAGVRLVNPFA